jgi:hypothetical protein
MEEGTDMADCSAISALTSLFLKASDWEAVAALRFVT